LTNGWRGQLSSYGLLGAAVLVFAVCLVLSVQKAALQHEEELREASENLGHAFQADYAMQRLRHALDLYALDSDAVDRDRLLGRIEALSSRLSLLADDEAARNVAGDPSLARVGPQMIRDLEQLAPDIMALEPGDGTQHAAISARLNEMASRLHHLVADVDGAIGLDDEQRVVQRRWMYRQETLYLLGMLGSGGVFIGMLLRESRRTRRLLAEATAAQVRIEHLAHHDPLTDLPNRWLFKDRLDQALRQAHRHHGMVAMHCVDVDHFKTINDRFGHVTGDHVLVAVARRMQDCLRESDTLARLGGDEFAIVQSALGGAGAAHLAERLLAAFRVPLSVDGCELRATVSIGIALYPAHAATAAALHRAADTALYRAKGAGRDRFHVWEPGDDRADLPQRYPALAG
jgi:diguanylate cyclase (GGDEF)-like protein